MSHDVFISYSNVDSAVANAACATFEQNGIRCWIAPRDVRGGSEWAEAIFNAIKRAKVMVLIFSSHANESRQVRREVELAVKHGLTIMPLRLEGIEPTHSMGYYMAGVHWIDALTPPLETHLNKMGEWIKSHTLGDANNAAPTHEEVKSSLPFIGVDEAASLIDRAKVLEETGSHAPALSLYRTIIERIDASPLPALDETLALALYNCGKLLRALGDHSEVVAACDELLRRFAGNQTPSITVLLAEGMLSRGNAMVDLRRYEDGLAQYEELLSRFANHQRVRISATLALTSYSRAVVLGKLGRKADAISAYDKLLAQPDIPAFPVVGDCYASALFNKGTLLVALGRVEDALSTFHDTVSRFGASSRTRPREEVAKALMNISTLLIGLTRYDEGLAACERLVGVTADTLEIERQVAGGMRNMAVALHKLCRPEESNNAAEQLIARFGHAIDPKIIENVAAAKSWTRSGR